MALTIQKRLLLSLAVSGAVLLLIEGAARLAMPHQAMPQTPQDSYMQADELLGWSAKPGEGKPFGVPRDTTINRLGTRNPEPTPKADDELRLLTLGDSTVFGVLVSDEAVFSSTAARYLSRKLRRNVTAFNGGIPGYSSEQARRLLEHRLAEVDYDFLVVATLWSDSQFGGIPDAMKYPERVTTGQRLLYNLATYRLLYGMMHGWQPTVVEWQLRDLAGGRRVSLSAYEANLTRFAQMARARGAEPVYLVLPSDRDLTGQPLEAPRPAYRAMMAQIAEEQGALLVDGASPFLGGDPSLMADDVHPSGQGHRLLGETLGAALQARLEAAQK
ncbi:MAG: lysophospholipase L1-like esterase [Myxococcota bacterium]|jgi:lysophospholipase L1-like esterase